MLYISALTEAQAELIQIYKEVTNSVDVLPFKDCSAGLPIANIFAPLLMQEDLKAKERFLNLDSPSGEELKSLREMFYIGDKQAKRIFMKGEAGCGKTFFCLKLLDTWCQVKQSGQVTDDALQQCLAVFDLVFYIPLRHCKGSLTYLRDMIGQTVSEQCLNLLITGGRRIQCLIILDGLDESPATFRELPRMDGIVNYVLFCTTRPWKLNQFSLTLSQNDKVVQILGLLPSSEKKVIEYVLINFYKVKKETPEFKLKFQRYLSMLKKSSLKYLVKIPMMLTACCCMWYEEDTYSEQSHERTGQVTIDSPTVHTSMTYTYLSLVDPMIRRADQKCDLRCLFTKTSPSTEINVPKVLASFSYIHSFLGAILPLCRLAYTDLVSGETKLVFQKDELESEIGHSLVEIALKVGIISQTKAPGRFHQQNVSVNFYHKSVQEFLAAVHLTCTDTDDIKSYCTSLDNVMNVANIITFIMGLDPSCSSVSKHVMDTVNADPDVQEYRQGDHGWDRVLQLYRTQCEWYRELTNSRTVTGDTSAPPYLHVTDICLGHWSDSNTVRLTGDLMSANCDIIVSVMLGRVRHPLHTVLTYLLQCPHLSMLYITYMRNKEDMDLLVSIIPRLTQLDFIEYYGAAVYTARDPGVAVEDVLPVYDVADMKVVKAALQLTQITYIALGCVDLGDDGLVVTADMARLQEVWLYVVHMSAGSWGRFISSLLTLHRAVRVILRTTNEDDVTLRRMQTSPHFTVTRDDGVRDGQGRYKLLSFTSVTPQTPTRLTQDDGGRDGQIEYKRLRLT